MSNRNFDAEYTIGKRLVEITGSFVPLTGAGTVVASTVYGFGFGYAPLNGVMALQPTARPGITSTPGIVRTGVGLYTITFDDSYRQLNFLDCTLASANTSGTGLWAQPVQGATNLATSGLAPTVTLIIVNSSGTPTEATSGQRVYFSTQFEDSTVQFQKP